MKSIEKNNISAILDKYFEALTSLEEEQQLRDYFAGEVAPEYAIYKPLFNSFSNERESLNNVKVDKNVKSTSSKKLHYWFSRISVISAAALVVLMFSIWPKQSDSLHLLINGVTVRNSELATSMAQTQLTRVNSMLGKYKQSNNQLEDLNRVGEAISPLMSMENVLKQNSEGSRLNDKQL
ncbi:MAG: hypothetical protein WCR61_03820 [Bacteroidales bacterium]|nr:hypothetical protein [Bacteroidales bacterium]MDD4655996.1 hypothetical protein [Bacteroidales bacterium]